MAVDRQARNIEWPVAGEDGKLQTWENVGIAVLMDIRRELRMLNSVLRCPNFLSIPRKLENIVKNTKRPKRKRLAKLKP